MIPPFLRGALAIILSLAIALPLAAQPFRDRHNAVTARNFDAGGSVGRQFHLQTGAYRYQSVIYRTDRERDLPAAPTPLDDLAVTHKGKESTLASYAAADPFLDGVIVLHRGAIAFEAYPQMQPWERHFAWSVTKVVTAATLAALAREGQVAMDAPVDHYLPDLAGTAWAGTSLQAIADMASGIACLDSDGYQNTATCVYTLEESLGITASTGAPRDFLHQLQTMERGRPADTRNEYVSANTNVLGLVIETVTGVSLAEAMQRHLWTPMGAEADGLMTINADAYAYASGGLSARLRDIARFGEIFTREDHLGVIDRALLTAMQTGGMSLTDASLEDLGPKLGEDLPARAAWQWDFVWDDGALFKSGYDGQGLYVDPALELVVAWFGTGRDFSAETNGMLPIARQIRRSLNATASLP